MTRITAVTADVYAFKEGALSAVGHDVRVHAPVAQFTWDEPSRTLSVEWDASALVVACAVRDGRDDPSALSDDDKRRIQRSLREEVLSTTRHPRIRARATGLPAEPGANPVPVHVELAGGHGIVTVAVRPASGGFTGEALLDQRTFGIPPFKAFMGALRIRPQVRVVVHVTTSG